MDRKRPVESRRITAVGQEVRDGSEAQTHESTNYGLRFARTSPAARTIELGDPQKREPRLVDVDKIQHWDSRGHFFAAAAEAMRRINLDSSAHGSR